MAVRLATSAAEAALLPGDSETGAPNPRYYKKEQVKTSKSRIKKFLQINLTFIHTIYTIIKRHIILNYKVYYIHRSTAIYIVGFVN